MSRYSMNSNGEWKRVNRDGSDWELDSSDGSGRPPRPYRIFGRDTNIVSPLQPDPEPEPELELESAENIEIYSKTDVPSTREAPLGTDFVIPLPDCYEVLPVPIRYQEISSNNNSEPYRIVELKEECVVYKEQYRIFRQYIESPTRIELDSALNGLQSRTSTSESVDARSNPEQSKVQTGKRGGRYTVAVTKEGRYYRKYF